MIDCPTCQDLLPDWLDDALERSRHEELETHLAACSECAPEAFALLVTRRLVGEAVRVSPSESLAGRIRAEARAKGLLEPTPARIRLWRPPAWAAAAVVLVAAGLGWALGPRPVEVVRGPTVVVEKPIPQPPGPRPSDPAPERPRSAPEAVREFWTAALVRE